METNIQQWGNSLAVRLPKETVLRLRLHRGSRVKITAKARSIVIEPQKSRPLTLEDLVKGITPKNRHKLLDWGPPRGKEIW